MKLCLLCKSNNADKSGSHIIPHFLLKRIDNEIGKSSRGKELGFTIGERDTTYYFGQSVLPEKLSEVFGELSNDDIENNKIPLIVDNLFCTDCEKRFSTIENEYAPTIENMGQDNNISPEFSFLFWISILWRISVFKHQGFILKVKEEELLRRILNKYLPFRIENFDFTSIRVDIDCINLSYRLIRCPGYSSNEGTYLFCHPYFCMPYSIIIDEFVLFFYFKRGHIDNLIQDFFGFEKFLKGKPINTMMNGEMRIIYDKSEFKDCLNKGTLSIVEKRFEHYSRVLDELHQKLSGHGKKMPQNLKSAIINRMSAIEKLPAKIYSFDNFIKATFEELKKQVPDGPSSYENYISK